MPFEEFFGNASSVDMIRRILRRQRLPNALLFTGPDAVGKRLLAKHLALALNCLGPQRDNWCGQCRQCGHILAESHPDVHTIEPDGHFIKIEQVRFVIREASFEPFQGSTKVFILDEAHRLHPTAANALLKVLEEPPERSKLVLVTSKPYSLLVTIRSRCQVIRFSALQTTDVEKILAQRAGLTAEEIRRRACVAGGSVGEALTIDLERHDALCRDAQRFLDVAARGGTVQEVSALVNRVAGERAVTEDWLKQLLQQLRRDVLARYLEEMHEPGFSLSQHAAIVEQVEELRRRLDHNVNRTMALESLFLRLVATLSR